MYLISAGALNVNTCTSVVYQVSLFATIYVLHVLQETVVSIMKISTDVLS